jgi:hypothetical protein
MIERLQCSVELLGVSYPSNLSIMRCWLYCSSLLYVTHHMSVPWWGKHIRVGSSICCEF